VQGALDKAIAHLEQQLQADPHHVKALDSLGFVLLERGDAVGGQGRLEQAVDIAPDDVDVLYDLARAYARNKQTDKAVEVFQHVLRLSPENSQAHYQLFLLYNRTQRSEEAKQELAEFQRLQEMDKMVRREEAALSKMRKAEVDRMQPAAPQNSSPGDTR